jgi:LuxR family transcriptional regulator, maltose regulon positive regulatory protein
MIAGVGAGEADATAGRVAGLGAGGVVAGPGLFGRLAGSARVTMVAAPAGSGKTVLLRSWINAAGLSGRAARVSAGRDERDPQHFWLAVTVARDLGLLAPSARSAR